MKKLIIGLMLFIMGLSVNVSAQVLNVDINTKNLNWAWVPGVGSGVVADYEVRCGQTTKVYTKMTVVAPTVNSLAVKTAVTGNGPWFCVVVARNQYTVGGVMSNEVPFVAGAGLTGTLTLTIP